MTPFVADPDFTLHNGSALSVLSEMPSESVDCCVTSPPYWGLRDYGHAFQIGLEASPEEYVSRLVAVFGEVRRVLAKTGTLWLNLGDTYAARRSYQVPDTKHQRMRENRGEMSLAGRKPKDIYGIPWLVAFALQADGWYLRSDIIWSKPNPMPESVTDRPTKAHEYVFLLSKSARYYFDADAVRVPYRYDGRNVTHVEGGNGSVQHRNGERWPGIGKRHRDARAEVIAGGTDESEPIDIAHGGRNVRSVWEIATQPYPEAHFAVFPPALAERCILAGCPQDGTVLDPFMGSGTTALVARKLGRRSIGIELNADYCQLAARRLSQQSLLAEATGG